MKRVLWLAAGLVIVASGCGKPMKMADMMKVPPRAAELDQLAPMAGNWDWSGKMTLCSSKESETMTGTSTVAWECDQRVMVERMQGKSATGEAFSGICMWTYDQAHKCFRLHCADSWGMTISGTATYNAETKTWTTKSCSPMGMSRGTMRLVDNNTMEMKETMYCMWGMCKVMTMEGSSKRK